jgi:hypothetical protein
LPESDSSRASGLVGGLVERMIVGTRRKTNLVGRMVDRMVEGLKIRRKIFVGSKSVTPVRGLVGLVSLEQYRLLTVKDRLCVYRIRNGKAYPTVMGCEYRRE